MTWEDAGSIALPDGSAVDPLTGVIEPRSLEALPDPQVQDVIRGAFVAVPPQPWQSYMSRAAYAAACALTDLGLAEPYRVPRTGLRGWWDRWHCRHVWRAHGFSDWRCPRCGKFR